VIVHLRVSRHSNFWRKMAYAWVSWLEGAQALLHVHPTGFMGFHEGNNPFRQRSIRARQVS
jgi:hypothetical protein